MRQNEINRIEIENAMERFFAGGGSITVIPAGVSGEKPVKPMRGQSRREVIEGIKRADAQKAKAKGRALV